jgi:hypothetical protein
MSSTHDFIICLGIIAVLLVYICGVVHLVDKFGYRIYKKHERLIKRWIKAR